MQPSRARDEFYFRAKINESQQGPPIEPWVGLGADLIYPGELSSEKVQLFFLTCLKSYPCFIVINQLISVSISFSSVLFLQSVPASTLIFTNIVDTNGITVYPRCMTAMGDSSWSFLSQSLT